MDSLKMYVNTCDATMFFLPIFSYFYEKYWSLETEVKVLGFKKPDFKLPERFEYISLADKQIGGVNSWSTYLVDFFEGIDDEIILWGIDDHIIADQIDVELFEILYKKILEDDTIGRISLIGNIQERRFDVIETFDDFEIIKQKNNTTYLIDCNFGLWRRDYLLKYLKRNWTPWEFEILGSQLSANSEYKVLGTTNRHCVQKVEGKRHFADGKINLLGVKYVDIIDIIKKGIIKKQDVIGEIDWIWIGKE